MVQNGSTAFDFWYFLCSEFGCTLSSPMSHAQKRLIHGPEEATLQTVATQCQVGGPTFLRGKIPPGQPDLETGQHSWLYIIKSSVDEHFIEYEIELQTVLDSQHTALKAVLTRTIRALPRVTAHFHC